MNEPDPMDWSSEDNRLVVKELLTAGDLVEAYDLHRKYHLSPGRLAIVALKLVAHGLAELRDTRLRLLPAGREYCVRHAVAIWGRAPEMTWKQVPEQFIRKDAAANALYSPKLFAIDPN